MDQVEHAELWVWRVYFELPSTHPNSTSVADDLGGGKRKLKALKAEEDTFSKR